METDRMNWKTGVRQRTLVAATLLLVTLALAPDPAQAAAPTLVGHWEGVIEVPASPLEVNLDFNSDAGTLVGDITIPAQGARDLPLTGISLEGSSAAFTIAGVPGEPTFNGTFSETGTILAGDFTQGGQTFPFRLVAAADGAAQAAATLDDLAGIISAALEDWKTPGLALAVVADGKVALARGFGRRSVADDLPVTADTLFAIGSSSKAFTTLLMGMLVDEGLLEWDRPVASYLADFVLHDEYATAHLTPRDMVSHRSGLPRHDLAWYNNETISRGELVQRLRYLPANKELRETWQYNNLMFLTAGVLVEELTGKSWEEAVQARILDPLGMTRSNFDVAVSQADADHSLPYVVKDDEVMPVDFRPITVMAPAGAINSTARDMARWLQLQLGEGSIDGRELLQPGTLAEMHLPQMVIPGLPREKEKSPMSYGLGWFVETWRGHLRVHHGGNIDGFSALVTLYPREGVGIVVLVNRNGSALPGLVTDTVSDRVLGLESRDWIGEAATRRDAARAFSEEGQDAKARFRVENTRPSRELQQFVGRYRHPGYGTLEIARNGDALTMFYNGMTMPLEHWHYDTFNVAAMEKEIIPENLRLTFLADSRGHLNRVEAPFEPMTAALTFQRLPEDRLSDPAFLARLAGTYQVPGQSLSVRVQGEGLVLQAQGQPALDLLPAGELEFDLKGVTGFSARFTLPDEGPAEALILVQPNGVFTATRVVEQD